MQEERPTVPFDSPQGTTMPRHIAGVLDMYWHGFWLSFCAKQVPDAYVVVQLIMGDRGLSRVLLYFRKHFLYDTSQVLSTGLVIRDFNGGRCSLRQTLIRTLFRLLEVNPALLGFLPAAASIVWSRHKQRFWRQICGNRCGLSVIRVRNSINLA